MYFHNDHAGDVKYSRLHAWDDGSELYKTENGNCRNVGKICDETKGICHQMTDDLMKSVHNKVRMNFPSKYRKLVTWAEKD